MLITTATIVAVLSVLIILHELSKGTTRNKEAYYLASRNVGIIPLTATFVMTEFNTATLIFFSAFGYSVGLKALLLPVVFLIGLIFYALVVAKKWKNFDVISTVDFFTSRFDKKIGFVTAVFLILAMAGFSATYLKSLTLLFSSLASDINFWIISAYLVIITLALVLKRGLVAIIKTDIMAFLVVIISLSWVLYKSLSMSPVLTNTSVNIAPDVLSHSFLVSLIPLTMFSYILAPWYGQRMFAAKSERVVVISVSQKRESQVILITILCAFITYLLSNIFVDNVLNKMILANIPVIALSFALLAGFYWPGVTKARVYVSLVIGLLSGIFFYVYYGDEGVYTYYWAFLGIPLILFSGILTSIVFKNKSVQFHHTAA